MRWLTRLIFQTMNRMKQTIAIQTGTNSFRYWRRKWLFAWEFSILEFLLIEFNARRTIFFRNFRNLPGKPRANIFRREMHEEDDWSWKFYIEGLYNWMISFYHSFFRPCKIAFHRIWKIWIKKCKKSGTDIAGKCVLEWRNLSVSNEFSVNFHAITSTSFSYVS